MAYKQKHDKSSFPFKSSPNKASYFSFSSSRSTERNPIEMAPIKEQKYGTVQSPMFKKTDPPNGKKPKDDDSDKMTDAENKAHEEKVEKYNKEKGNYEKMSKNPALVKKITNAGKQIRAQIDKLNNKSSLSDDDKARLADLKRDYASNQRLLHNIRGKTSPKKSLLNPEGADRVHYTWIGQDERPRVRRRTTRRYQS